MKKLRRKLSNAFKSGHSSANLNNNSINSDSNCSSNTSSQYNGSGLNHNPDPVHFGAYENTAVLDGLAYSHRSSSLSIPALPLALSADNYSSTGPTTTSYNPNGRPNGSVHQQVHLGGLGAYNRGTAGGQQYRSWSRLSDSMSHLAERLAQDGIIVEEYNPEDHPHRPVEPGRISNLKKGPQATNRPAINNNNNVSSRHYSINGANKVSGPSTPMRANRSHHQLSALGSGLEILEAKGLYTKGRIDSRSGSTSICTTSTSVSRPCSMYALSTRQSNGSLADIQMIDSAATTTHIDPITGANLVVMRPNSKAGKNSNPGLNILQQDRVFDVNKAVNNVKFADKKKKRYSWHASRWFFGGGGSKSDRRTSSGGGVL
ncbi:hypothetical protein DdX_10624 [Ditylenchus destructor]|uniref:Uncharacterized protein n=1 Tax=Ditylenchus destructor TaxID=166010 RepID=A0AAD4N0R5_9BILA|nr:hypothetical protein DdX_10624 [Ditylenchus destructor]